MSRILFLAPRPVWPAFGGGQVRAAGLLDLALSAGHEVLLVQPAGGYGYPRRSGLTIHEVPLRSSLGAAVAKVFSHYPLRSPRMTSRGRGRASAAVRSHRPDVVVLSGVHAVSLRTLAPQDRPYVYDAENVEHELYRSMLRTARTWLDRGTFAVDLRRVSRAERQMLAGAAAVTSVSVNDLDALRRLAPVRSAVVVPSSVPLPSAAAPRFSDRPPSVLFLGSLDYPPNIAAVEELVTVVVPRIRERLSEARLLVAGRRAPAGLKRTLLELPWCELREDVEDVKEVYADAHCMVLPIRYGSGTRLKVYECLAHGLPLVATAQAVAGVPVVNGRHVLLRESPSDLADAALDVLQGDVTAARLSEGGRALFEADLAWERVSSVFVSLLVDLAASRR